SSARPAPATVPSSPRSPASWPRTSSAAAPRRTPGSPSPATAPDPGATEAPRSTPSGQPGGIAKRTPSGRGSVAGGLRGRGFLLLDEFALDRDLNFLAHHEPAVQHRVEAQAEILPVDLGRGAVGDAVSHHPLVVELPAPRYVEDHGVGGLL